MRQVESMELQALNTQNAEEHDNEANKAEDEPTVETKYEQKPQLRFSLLGIVFAILSAFSASVMAMFVKLAKSVPAFETVWFRSIVVIIFILPHLIYYRVRFLSYSKQKSFFLIGRGVIGATAVLLKYFSLKRLPLADVTVITFTTPVFAAIFGFLFLKETLHKLDALAAILSFGGVMLTARPEFIFGSTSGQDFSEIWLPVLASILGAAFTALSFICIRKLGKIETTIVIFYLTLAMFVTSLIASVTDGKLDLPECETNENWYLFLVGISAILVQVFLTKALSKEKAVICSLARTSSIVFAFIWQVSIFSLQPSMYSIGGAVLILLCNVAIFVRKYIYTKKKMRELLEKME